MTRRKTKPGRSGRPAAGKRHVLIWMFLFIVIIGAVAYLTGNTGRDFPGIRQMITQAEEKKAEEQAAHGDYRPLSAVVLSHVHQWASDSGAEARDISSEDKKQTLDSGTPIFWTHTDVELTLPDHANISSITDGLTAGGHIRFALQPEGTAAADGGRAVKYDLILTDICSGTAITLHPVSLLVRQAKTGQAAGTAAPGSAPVKGVLALCVDDCGGDLETQQIYENLGVPVTLSVMPNRQYTRQSASEGAAAGLEIILHQPMEPESDSGMEPRTILTSMSDDSIRAMLRESLSQVPQAAGINNHQGSKATADKRVMAVVMQELKQRGLFFFDSRTSAASVGAATASAYGVRSASNSFFIDNSSDEASIRARLQQAGELAARNGSVIIIGHCRPHTAQAVKDMVPILRSQGIRFVFLSDVMR